jgi:dTDP-4-dehydrorhamnose 3,5-epimerase
MSDNKITVDWQGLIDVEGVKIGRNRTINYNSSQLVEIYRYGSQSLYSSLPHLYWIVTPKDVYRRFGVHEYTTDTYSVVYGEIQVALYDNRSSSGTNGNLKLVTLNGDFGDALFIPPGVWHTFRSITEIGILLNPRIPLGTKITQIKLRLIYQILGLVFLGLNSNFIIVLLDPTRAVCDRLYLFYSIGKRIPMGAFRFEMQYGL